MFLVQSRMLRLCECYATSSAVHSTPSEPRQRTKCCPKSEENLSTIRLLRAAECLKWRLTRGDIGLPSGLMSDYLVEIPDKAAMPLTW